MLSVGQISEEQYLMNSRAPELRLTVFPPDGDLAGLWISATNGHFSGLCTAYSSIKILREFVDRLEAIS